MDKGKGSGDVENAINTVDHENDNPMKEVGMEVEDEAQESEECDDGEEKVIFYN